MVNIYFWIGFHILIFLILALDLGVFSRKEHKVPLKEALIWVSAWVVLAILFNVFVYYEFGKTKALEFLTGYVIEYSLSVDNIFVFILIFTYFAVPEKYQHKILFWGILGALIMRGIFIFAGVALINRFHWIILIFGAFLVITGIRMLFQSETHVDPEKNPVVRFARRFMPVTKELHGSRLFVREGGKLFATPLFLVLLVIESSDLIFAVDSIPAVLAISHDRFIVYTSNIFAILGLRSLYFAVNGIMGYFRYLKTGLAFVLAFVGFKMLASFFHFEIPILLSLGVITGILLLSILFSIIIRKNKESI
ncbi:MAG TPA: TerC family protein [Bacteroidales bacterium]|nr:TerC family protein [Bacteroidales bacterium]HPF03336.1 TerC family protein [Bacteroidales bacterium]HPJ59181.1 TerC family protein [Bacteroidales bacterium]HPR12793.1 TerC family protein [Bacteroidales bacterium]HRW84397.1 TerC family protein [Bacteroidales bacterium]